MSSCEKCNSMVNELLHLCNLTFIDLFCGVGGFHQALSKFGAKCVLACDIDKNCRVVYKDNYGIEPVPDVKKIDEKTMPDFDILCAGFPCFVAGNLVLTNSCYKKIEDVSLEDQLLTHTGKFQKILNLQSKSYTGNLYHISVKHHPEVIICTKEHPFYVRKKDGNKWLEPVWKKACELSNDDYYGMVINRKNEIPTFQIEVKINKSKTIYNYITLDNEDMWFLLGYFLGDGWIEETKKIDGRIAHKIRFSINNKDEEYVLNRLRKILPITDKKCDTGKCKKFGCANITWYTILKNFGKYAHGKIIPEWVQDAPENLIKEFINGYIKADGCLTKNDTIQIISVSNNIAYGIQRLYLKLGHVLSVTKHIPEDKKIIEGRVVNQRPFYQIKGKLQKEKKIGYFIEKNYAWFKIKNDIVISNTVNTPVYNFEVEEDNSYIVQNVIAHNCQAFSNGGKKKCFDDERGLLFDEIIRIASHKKPKFMFLENVKHILKVNDGKVIEYIKNKIDQTGYKLQLFQLSPHNYGIPQQRERVYFVCIRNDIYNGEDILLPPHKKCEDFTKFLDKNIDQKYYIKGDVLDVLNAWDEMVKKFQVGEKINPTIMIKEAYKTYTTKEFNDLPAWKRDCINKNKPLINKYENQFREWYEKYSSLLDKREIYAQLEWQTGAIKPDDSIFNHFIQIRQSGVRVKKGEYFPTLVAISQIPIYGKEKRYITPRECARLQSFPETFKLSANDKITYKQMGNSVNVDNVYTVISATFERYFK